MAVRVKLEFAIVDGMSMYRRFCEGAPRANRDVFDRIRYLDVNEMFKEHHIVCHTDKGRVVGDLALEQSPEVPENLWVKHVSVDQKFQRQGIATRLVDLCFDFARTANKRLEVSTYSDEGLLYLRPLFERTSLRYPTVGVLQPDQRDLTPFRL